MYELFIAYLYIAMTTMVTTTAAVLYFIDAFSPDEKPDWQIYGLTYQDYNGALRGGIFCGLLWPLLYLAFMIVAVTIVFRKRAPSLYWLQLKIERFIVFTRITKIRRK